MNEDTLFRKIVLRKIPADILFQDDQVTAFRDTNPQAPTHILIIPNKTIHSVNEITPEDESTLGRLLVVAKRLAENEGISDKGYRLIINCGVHGGQEVHHLHMHLVGGKPLGRMLPSNSREA
jgi:histidine triad (HIT) family protein